MLLSKTCINAIRATLELASHTSDNNNRFVPVKTVANAIGISHHSLGKVAQILTEKGILTSFRGPNGGIGLVKPADQVFLIDIIEAIDGLAVFEKCILGFPKCDEGDPCSLHHTWKRARDGLLRELERESVANALRKRGGNEPG